MAATLTVCPRCGVPVPAFTSARCAYEWQRGHEEACR